MRVVQCSPTSCSLIVPALTLPSMSHSTILSFAPTLSRPLPFTRHARHLLTRRSSPAPSTARFLCLTPQSSPANTKVGFIGLGVMGLPMAINLSSCFPSLLVWNRSDKKHALKAAIGDNCVLETASTPAQVVAGSDVTFSMLSTPEVVNRVFFEMEGCAMEGVKEGKTIVDCSTLKVEDMVRTAGEVGEKGGRFLEAPVSGSKGPAEGGTLLFLCAGDKWVFDHLVVKEALNCMGKRAWYLGDVGNGTKMKLVINQLMATMLASLGESIVLSEALGLSVPDMLEIISLGAMNNPMFALKGPKMKHGAKGYETNFPLEHAQKDIRFAQLLGDDHGINMSVSSAANEWYKAAKGLGLSRDDFAAVIESIRSSAGRS